MRKWMALLLVLCLLLGSVAALAEQDTTYSYDAGEVNGSCGTGIQVDVDAGSGTISVDKGENPPTVEDLPTPAPTAVEVAADSVTEAAEEDVTGVKVDTCVTDVTVDVEGGIDVKGETRITGVAVNVDEEGSATIATTEGGIDATATNENGSAYSYGVHTGIKDGSAKFAIKGNISATATGGTDAYAYGFYSDSNNYADIDLTSEDITATSEGAYANATSASVYTCGGDVKIDAGKLTAAATATTDERAYSTGLYVDSDSDSDSEKTVFIQTDSITATAKNAADGGASAYGVDTCSDHNGPVFIQSGSVSAGAESADAGAEACAVDANSKDGLMYIVAGGDISAEAKGKYASATGVDATARNAGMTIVEVHGDVTAKGTGDSSNAVYGIQAGNRGGELTGVGVMGDEENGKKGDVTATGKDSVGVGFNTSVNYMEVAAPALGAVLTEDSAASIPEENTIVFVNGTVSGEGKAVEFAGYYDDTKGCYNLNKSKLVTWAANTAGETDSVAQIAIAVSHDGPGFYTRNAVGADNPPTKPVVTDKEDEKAAAALKAAISYIVKVADDSKEKLTVSESLNETFEINEDYRFVVAHEEDSVTVTLADGALGEDEALDGIFYDEGQTNLLTIANGGLVKDGENLLLKMARGGAMMLGLKTHKHDYQPKERINVVPATCAATGSYDQVYACSICGEEKTETGLVIDKLLTHTPGKAKQEDVVPATCTEAGSCNNVVYCTVCNEKLSTTPGTIDPTGHTPGNPVKENVVPATETSEGKYDSVVYCTVCNAELSRTEVIIPMLVPEEEDEEEDNSSWTLVYTPVDDNVAVNGVKAADRLGMTEALIIIGNSLDKEIADGAAAGGNGADSVVVIVTFKNADQLLDPEEMARFNRLTVKDRMLVFQRVLGFGVKPEDPKDEMSDDAKALLADVETRLAEMSDAEKAEREKLIDRLFLPRLIVVDKAEHESVGIELIIDRGGEKSYERYTFFDDEGEWKLYRIEKGEFRKA